MRPFFCAPVPSLSSVVAAGYAFLKQHYAGHVDWAILPTAPTERTVLREPTTQEVQMGVDGFVEQFVPWENWPEPHPVSPDVYRAALESLQQTPGSATVAAEAAAEIQMKRKLRRTRYVFGEAGI